MNTPHHIAPRGTTYVYIYTNVSARVRQARARIRAAGAFNISVPAAPPRARSAPPAPQACSGPPAPRACASGLLEIAATSLIGAACARNRCHKPDRGRMCSRNRCSAPPVAACAAEVPVPSLLGVVYAIAQRKGWEGGGVGWGGWGGVRS